VSDIDVTTSKNFHKTRQSAELLHGLKRVEHLIHARFILAEFLETILLPIFIRFDEKREIVVVYFFLVEIFRFFLVELEVAEHRRALAVNSAGRFLFIERKI